MAGKNQEKRNRKRFHQRLNSMLCVDFRRMFTMRFLYIMAGICFVMPVLILVMTTMMDGSVTVDPQTGAETVIEGFANTWQIIGTLSSESAAGMSMTSMCNINLLYFLAAVLVCVFVADDFRSGYAKNLFAVRAKKSEYFISKTLVGIAGGVCMFLAFFAGAMLGGAVAGLPFDMEGTSAAGIVMCLLAKLLLLTVFVPIYVTFGVIAKSKLWMALVGSLCAGMLFFMMIPMLTPLDATAMNVLLCLAGGVLFGAGLGAVSGKILRTTSLV